MSFENQINFKTIECQHYCVRVADGTHDSPKETIVGKRLVTSKNVKNGNLELDTAYFISEHEFESINKRSKVDQWDLLVTMIGTVGEICLVMDPNPDFAIKNVGLLKCGDELKARWLYYFLRSPQGRLLMEERKKGSTQQYLSLTELRKLPITFPDDSQSMLKIIQNLICIDDRIALLRETNATLEAIAQALFKSWFVDFDPVRAKSKGEIPEGVDEVTAALFTDSFEQSELGMIPKGWNVSSVYSVAKVTYGAPFASKLFKDAPPGVPIVRIRDLKDESPGVFTEEKHPNGYLIQPGDIVVGMDGEFKSYVWGGEEAWLNQRVCVFSPVGEASSAFVRMSIAPLLAAVESTETATTVIHLGKNDIDRFKILIPSNEILKVFSSIADPIYSRFVKNKQQMQTLVNLRDTLLPRLISGQLCLPDAEEEFEKATP